MVIGDDLMFFVCKGKQLFPFMQFFGGKNHVFFMPFLSFPQPFSQP